MIQRPQRGRGAAKPGIVFIIALSSMLAMVLIGTVFVGSASQQLQDARRDIELLQASAMADAGVNYFIWRQRYSGDAITSAYNPVSNIRALAPGSTPTPQIVPASLTLGEGTSAVWLFRYLPEGTTQEAYQVVSKGYYRGRERVVRSVLQGPVTQNTNPDPDPIIIPPNPRWMDYAIFSNAPLTISSSTDVTGNIATNSDVTVDISGGGSITGNVYAAGAVNLSKGDITGQLTYGSTVYDKHGNVMSAAEIEQQFPGAAKLPDDQPKRIEVDGMDPLVYKTWADRYGSSAYFSGTNLSNVNQGTSPILYVNAAQAANFELTLGNLKGPLTVFVEGDIKLSGNIQVGDPDNPVALIATGKIVMNGTPTVYGVVWAHSGVNGGTSNIYGTLRVDQSGYIQGNPQIHWQQYNPGLIVPPPPGPDPDPDPNNVAPWTMGSWEML